MALARAWLPDGSLPRAADLTRRRQTGFGEPLLLREVVVLDEGGEIFTSCVCVGVVVDGGVGWGCV